MLTYFMKGILIGFAIAAPVGPIGILCIQRSLNHGFKIGLITGLGAAIADGVYGLLAGFGLITISSFLISHQFWIRFIGGLFLIYLGIKLIYKHTSNNSIASKDNPNQWSAFVTTFFLTLMNPMTILSFIGVLAGLGLGSNDSNITLALLLVLGVIVGSTCWWLLLSFTTAFILGSFHTSIMNLINKSSGIIILIFGLYALKMQ